MKKTLTEFVCSSCDYTSPKWLGKCPRCGEWNSLMEENKTNKQKKTVLLTGSFRIYYLNLDASIISASLSTVIELTLFFDITGTLLSGYPLALLLSINISKLPLDNLV